MDYWTPNSSEWLPHITDGYPIEFIQKGTAGWVKEWAE